MTRRGGEPDRRLPMGTCGSAACVALLSAALVVLSAPAGDIRYEPESNRIMVSAYPEERPATLSDMLEADQQHGWGKVTYEPATDTFTVRADLWIGTDTDFGTFVQIGHAQHPTETLVLHGHLVVCAPRRSGQRTDGRYRISNRLTLGQAGNPASRAILKIACTKKNEFGVSVLTAPLPQAVEDRHDLPAGEWFMFNSVLTAATPDADHTYTAAIRLSHAGINYRLENSTISWWDGGLFATALLYTRRWIPEQERAVRGMVFEHGGSARGPFPCTDCIFRDVAVARVDDGATRCVFQDNRANYQITAYQVGAVFTDCVFRPAAEPVRVPRSKRNEKWLRNYSVYRDASDLQLVLNPGVIERVSVPVAVTDAGGRPIEGAAVLLDCPQDEEGLAVVRSLAVTDADGLTPSDPDGRALLITRRELRPTDDPAKPQVLEYSYRLRVTAPGHAGHELELPANAVLPRPLPVMLNKAR